jgi:hypothetical protein
MSYGLCPPIFPLKKISETDNPCQQYKEPPAFSKIDPQSTKFLEHPWFLKIIPDIALATSRNYK